MTPLRPGCPFCGSSREPLLWAQDATTGARTFRCAEPGCGRRWGVDGVQDALPLGEVEAAQLRLV
jgi:hypothetical protein